MVLFYDRKSIEKRTYRRGGSGVCSVGRTCTVLVDANVVLSALADLVDIALYVVIGIKI